jgi:hypothetical protein
MSRLLTCQPFHRCTLLGDTRNIGHSATPGAEAARERATDQGTSAISLGDGAALGAEATRERATDQSTSATSLGESPLALSCSDVLMSLSCSQIVASIQSFRPCALPIESRTADSPWQRSPPPQGPPRHRA